MTDRTPLPISIQILTRPQMTTGSLPNSCGPWVYHHIQPVRVYYLTAALLLRVITNEFCWARTRTLAKDALGQMCNLGANRTAIASFVDANVGAVITDAAIQGMANRCSNPPFGGFAGPNPGQRNDDPGGSEELVRPRSMDPAWWDAIFWIRDTVYTAFGLGALPLPQQICQATKPVFEWCNIVEALRTYIDLAHGSGSAFFDPTDWIVPGHNGWTMRRGNNYVMPINRPPMRLRLAAERKEYLEFESFGYDDPTRLATIGRRGVMKLARQLNDPNPSNNDYLNESN